MATNNVPTKSLPYRLLKNWTRLALRLFYHRRCVVGYENVPTDAGVLFAGNHQNALMDPLNILCVSNRQPFFVARSDIFTSPLVVRLLHFLKIYPVFRPRDGWRNMSNNEATFDFLVEKLQRREVVGIFPEGTASYYRRLLPLKKGLARLALRTAATTDVPIVIVPIGVYYSSVPDFQSDLVLHFGKALPMADYLPLYHENQGKALRQLTIDVREKLSSLMLDIQSNDHYAFIDFMRRLAGEVFERGRLSRPLFKRFQVEQQVVHRLLDLEQSSPTTFNQLKEQATALQEAFQPQQLPIAALVQHKSLGQYFLFGLYMILLFPLLIVGTVFNYPIYRLCVRLTQRRVKDPQFLATALFGFYFILFPAYYLVLSIVAALVFQSIWLIPILWLVLPSTGLLAFHHARKFRLFKHIQKANPFRQQYKEVLDSLISWVSF